MAHHGDGGVIGGGKPLRCSRKDSSTAICILLARLNSYQQHSPRECSWRFWPHLFDCCRVLLLTLVVKL